MKNGIKNMSIGYYVSRPITFGPPKWEVKPSKGGKNYHMYMIGQFKPFNFNMTISFLFHYDIFFPITSMSILPKSLKK
jgi:hypothetical protein